MNNRASRIIVTFFVAYMIGAISSPICAENAEPNNSQKLTKQTLSDGTVFQGAVLNGVPSGKGTLSFQDGRVYEGELSASYKPNGEGLMRYSNGWSYEGKFENGLMNGQGFIRRNEIRLTSGMFKELRPGYVELEEVNGERYIGGFENGQRAGDGVRYLGEGEIMKGSYRDNYLNGRGTLEKQSGERYEGNFVSDWPEGQGVLRSPNGIIYDGAFVRGKKQGRGTMSLPNGDRFEGTFLYDRAVGPGTFYHIDGRKLTGVFNNDKPNGEGSLMWPNGDRYDGNFENGKMHGKGKATFANNTYFVGSFKDSKFDTGKIFTSPPEQKLIATYTNGVRENVSQPQYTAPVAASQPAASGGNDTLKAVVEGLFEILIGGLQVANENRARQPVYVPVYLPAPINSSSQKTPEAPARPAGLMDTSKYPRTPLCSLPDGTTGPCGTPR